MDYRDKTDPLPKLIEPVLEDNGDAIDNLFSDLWKQLKIPTLLSRAGITKRSGHDVSVLVYLHLMWRWMGSSSIGFFCKKSLRHFYQVHHSAIYDLLNNPKLNWRGWQLSLAKKCIDRFAQGMRVLVVDDSIKQRRSKKMDGVSIHYDHSENRCVTGHQVVSLGLSCESGYFPLDSEISIGTKGVQQKGTRAFDARTRAMRRFKEAFRLSKLELVAKMVRRALKRGIQAQYLAADSWFGNKAMMALSLECGLTGILRMKNGKLKYRVDLGEGRYQMLSANEIYQRMVRGRWHKSDIVPGGKWQTFEVLVEVNLAESNKHPDNWQQVKLLFVRGVNLDENKTTSSKRDWALFLSTDAQISAAQMLEVYAMRWAIEVYFRESKQHLKWLGEQGRSYATHVASLHLSAACYLMLVYAQLSHNLQSITQAREHIHETVEMLNYAKQLWQAFRVIVYQALDSVQAQLGVQTTVVMCAIDKKMEDFLVQILQLDPQTIRHDHDPSGVGIL